MQHRAVITRCLHSEDLRHHAVLKGLMIGVGSVVVEVLITCCAANKPSAAGREGVFWVAALLGQVSVPVDGVDMFGLAW